MEPKTALGGAADRTSAAPRPVTGGAWALLLGIGLLMLGNGLQGTLLGVRATLEGYSSGVIGLVMSGFFMGFLLGAAWTSRAVRRVGHIRVFAALASVASISILVHALLVDPWVWGLMRFVTGICFAGILVVAESWLNGAATNQTRGQLLSLYMLATFGGMGGGQLMLNIGDPGQTSLFILVSILISFAALPLLLSASAAPAAIEPVSVGLLRLYRVSPLGTMGTFGAGLINGTVFGMGAVYAHQIGLSLPEISIFMGVLVFGGALLQWPVGKLSDLIDRRLVIAMITFATGVAAAGSSLAATMDLAWFLGAVGLFGGLGFSIHALCLAYTNDHLEPTEYVGASSGLVLILGTGSIVGPLAVGAIMGTYGPSGFFWWLALVSLSVTALSLWRMTRRESLPTEEQGPFVAMTTQTSPVAVAAAEEVHAEELQTS